MNSAFALLFGNFEYERFHNIAPLSAAFWFWAYIVCMVLIMLNLLIAIIFEHYMEVKEQVGEAGQSIFQQTRQLWADLRWKYSYEGSRKTVPISDLLMSITSDPARLRNRGTSRDKKPQTREERQKRRREESRLVTAEYLTDHGCDVLNARRLLEKCALTASDDTREHHTERLVRIVEGELDSLDEKFTRMEETISALTEQTSNDLDRIALKQLKVSALMRRVLGSTTLPDGWKELRDDDGRVYYYNERTGMTSWTLPRDGGGPGGAGASPKALPSVPGAGGPGSGIRNLALMAMQAETAT